MFISSAQHSIKPAVKVIDNDALIVGTSYTYLGMNFAEARELALAILAIVGEKAVADVELAA